MMLMSMSDEAAVRCADWLKAKPDAKVNTEL